MVQVLPVHENEVWNKRVESTGRPCLDEGSIPSSSTSFRPREDFTLVRVLALCPWQMLRRQSRTFVSLKRLAGAIPSGSTKGCPREEKYLARDFFILSQKVPICCLFAISELNVKWRVLERETPKIRTWLRWFSNITKVVGKRHT